MTYAVAQSKILGQLHQLHSNPVYRQEVINGGMAVQSALVVSKNLFARLETYLQNFPDARHEFAANVASALQFTLTKIDIQQHEMVTNNFALPKVARTVFHKQPEEVLLSIKADELLEGLDLSERPRVAASVLRHALERTDNLPVAMKGPALQAILAAGIDMLTKMGLPWSEYAPGKPRHSQQGLAYTDAPPSVEHLTEQYIIQGKLVPSLKNYEARQILSSLLHSVERYYQEQVTGGQIVGAASLYTSAAESYPKTYAGCAQRWFYLSTQLKGFSEFIESGNRLDEHGFSEMTDLYKIFLESSEKVREMTYIYSPTQGEADGKEWIGIIKEHSRAVKDHLDNLDSILDMLSKREEFPGQRAYEGSREGHNQKDLEETLQVYASLAGDHMAGIPEHPAFFDWDSLRNITDGMRRLLLLATL